MSPSPGSLGHSSVTTETAGPVRPRVSCVFQNIAVESGGKSGTVVSARDHCPYRANSQFVQRPFNGSVVWSEQCCCSGFWGILGCWSEDLR